MPGRPLTGQGGQSGGPRYGWGQVRGTGEQAGARHDANSGLNRGRFTASPEAGLHRAEWQWRGHGPDAMRDYGWDYRGGVGRDEITQRTEARTGGGYQAQMAQERSGGLPRGDYAVDYSRLGEGRGRRPEYDREWQGRSGGMHGGMNRGYGADYQGGFGGRGMRAGGYGAQGYDRPMRGEVHGGLERGDAERLSDREFLRRVERW